MPVPRPQYFDTNGNPLAFGCVFTYAAGSTSPLATFTDETGTVQNANPVVLSAAGYGSIWIQAGLAYRIKVASFGGVNCASGATQYTVDGVGAGVTTLTTTVTYSPTPVFTDASQNQLFKITLSGDATSQPLTAVGVTPPGLITWEISQDVSGGHAFSWPANSIGGCTIGSAPNQTTLQHFIWDGFNAIATGPCVVGNGPAIDTGPISGTTATFSTSVTAGAFISSSVNPAVTGLLRLSNPNAINWRNFANNADEGLSTDNADRLVISHPSGAILAGALPYLRFGGTSNTLPMLKQVGTELEARLADDSGDAPLSASTLSWGGAGGPTLSGACVAGNTIVASSSTALSCAALPPSLLVHSAQTSLTNSSINNCASGCQTVITQNVTMPATGCPCRVHASWWLYLSSAASGQDVAYVTDGTAGFAGAETATPGSASGFGLNGAGYSTQTYNNTAVVTFSIIMASSHAGGTTVSTSQLGTSITGSPASSLVLDVYGSN
jgi:hypothetical protein